MIAMERVNDKLTKGVGLLICLEAHTTAETRIKSNSSKNPSFHSHALHSHLEDLSLERISRQNTDYYPPRSATHSCYNPRTNVLRLVDHRAVPMSS